MNWKTQVMPGPVRMISKVVSTFSSSAFFSQQAVVPEDIHVE